MTLVADNSIPYPSEAAELWDRINLRGTSGTLYTWPLEMTNHGVCKVELSPPQISAKESKKVGAKKPRRKETGQSLGKITFSFEVTPLGWPTFVDLWRLLSEAKDGPWRVLHPEVDTFDMRLFVVESQVKLDGDKRQIVKATVTLKEIEPETQAGNGASSGVNSPGAIAYNKAAEADFAAERAAFDAETKRLEAAQKRIDEAAANGQAQKVRTIQKAEVFVGKTGL